MKRIGSYKSKTKTCATLGCEKPVTSQGFCCACYARNMRYGEIEPGAPTERLKHRLSNINELNQTAICTTCNEVQITKKSGGGWRCSIAVMERRRKYNISRRQSRKDRLLVDYCEICGAKDKLCWDHNHSTGNYRGTLCEACNIAIGLLKDDPNRCISAAEYLKTRNI